MQNKRLGCLTGTGIIAALITISIIIGYAFTSGSLIFSPGALNAKGGETLGGVTSHAEIGSNCKACHTAPWESATMADRCTVCHGEIATDMQKVASMHGKMLHDNPNLGCRHCHPEHRGANAQLTVMNGELFPHETVGYSLAGHQRTAAGLPFTCDDCHHGDISTFASDSSKTCHRQMDVAFTQAHLLAFGTDCLACHDGVDRYGEDFNHSRFTFKLTGKHANVICTLCHLNARTVADLQSLSQNCNACHHKDEPHEGRFGLDCAKCHSTEGWKPAKFDHNLAKFKLTDSHANVKCEECHTNNTFKGTPTDCYSCHKKDDHHNGKFGTDCSACHRPTQWEDVTFGHNKSKFPLTGAHTKVACEKCHSTGQFTALSTACASCHGDPGWHKGAFGLECQSCHNTSGWSGAKFSGQHPSFGEEGGIHHGGASCTTCHTVNVFTATCTACHKNGNPGDGGGGGENGGGGGG